MTTIAFRDGVLAADTRMVTGSRPHLCTKIRYIKPNLVVACAGSINKESVALKFFSKPNWQDEEPPEIKGAFQCIILIGNNPFFCEGGLHIQPIEHPYFAIGSGAEVAAAAMEMGMSAEEAVKFASKLDINTNDIVTTYKIPNAKEKSAVKKPKATQ